MPDPLSVRTAEPVATSPSVADPEAVTTRRAVPVAVIVTVPDPEPVFVPDGAPDAGSAETGKDETGPKLSMD